MLVIGALLGSLLMWWFFFVPPLVALVVAIFGVRRARRFLGETRPNPPRPGPGLHA
jgi:hypothetical protein